MSPRKAFTCRFSRGSYSLFTCPPVSFTPAGTPINKRPVLGYRNLNLFKLYRLVHKLGGFDNVSDVLAVRLKVAVTLVSCLSSIKTWSPWNRLKVAPCGSRSTRTSASPYSTQPPATTSNVPTASKQTRRLPCYSMLLWLFICRGSDLTVFSFRYLYGFEEYCTSTAITFRMDLPLKQSAKGEGKSEGDAGGAATSSSSEEQAALLDTGPSKAPALLCKVRCCVIFWATVN